MSNWRNIVDDPRTWAAIDQLLERGLCDGYVFHLLQQLSILPDMWAALDSESPEDKVDRRHRLAHEIRVLSLKLDDDPEAKHDRIDDYKAITNRPDRPTISEFLCNYADTLEHQSGKMKDIYDKYLIGKKTTRNDKTSFVCREIIILLHSLLPSQSSNPVSPVTKLASVLLNEVITTEKIKQTYRRFQL